MTFLYETELKNLAVQCPPAHYKPINTAAFRFVSADVQDMENFKPVYFKNPRRVNAYEDTKKCQAMALSFYNEGEAAKTEFRQLKKHIGNNVYKALGSHLAFTNITEKDGVNSNVSNNGHFSNHPVVDCDYQNRFVNLGSID